MLQSSTATIGVPAVRYSAVAIVLHWAIAVLLAAEVALGLRMVGTHGPARFAVFQLHKSIGITILLLVALRLVWRFYRRPPRVGAHGWERTLAHVVHALFYLLLFALPLSGWLIVSTSRILVPTLLYGLIPWPHIAGVDGLTATTRAALNATAEFVHVNLVTGLYVLVALHVAGALKHQWFDRDGDIARMAPGVRPGRIADPRLLAIGFVAVLVVGLAQRLPMTATPAARTAAIVPVAVPPVAAATAAAATVTPSAAPSTAAAPIVASPVAPPAVVAARAMPIVATAASWAIQPGSTLHWRTTWSGDAIAGGFTKFDGTVVFDPDALDRSHVALAIDTTTVFSGDAQRDETLRSADWFATGTSPVATYAADHFRRTAPGHFIATGKLGLKGVTLPIPVTFTLTIAGDTATMHGTATIDRTAFKIGEGEFAATGDIPAAVALDIAITAKRQ